MKCCLAASFTLRSERHKRFASPEPYSPALEGDKNEYFESGHNDIATLEVGLAVINRRFLTVRKLADGDGSTKATNQTCDRDRRAINQSKLANGCGLPTNFQRASNRRSIRFHRESGPVDSCPLCRSSRLRIW